MTLKTFSWIFVFSVCAAGTTAAQPFGAGLKVGIPLNDAFKVAPGNTVQYAADTHRYTIGPYVEFRIPYHFSIEVDALYKSYAFQVAQPVPGRAATAGSWEFPVVAKYRVIPGPIQPYIEGGVAFSTLTNVFQAPELANRNNFGVVIGAGVEMHLLLLRISPEIRYNGWTLHDFSSPGNLLQSNRNQATLLVGISF